MPVRHRVSQLSPSLIVFIIFKHNLTVSPVQGKPSEVEVMVQGKQIKAVSDLLIAKGVPKRWIESADLSAEKKKKK